MNQEPKTKITVTDIDIPFSRLVVILLKLMLAAIPEMILFYMVFFVLALLFVGVFGGGAAILNGILHH